MNTNKEMYGVIEGYYTCNHDRDDEINRRIYDRNVPSANLQPQYSIRPTSTKYGYMQVLDQYNKSTVPLKSYSSYSTTQTFNPGNAQAPWSGYSNNVNVESTLRNQFFALQNCEQSTYIPSSTSDLYNTKVEYTQQKQTHPLLFEQPEFNTFNPNSMNIANSIFNNHTRYDVKNTPC
jgi:hypothetical protein